MEFLSAALFVTLISVQFTSSGRKLDKWLTPNVVYDTNSDNSPWELVVGKRLYGVKRALDTLFRYHVPCVGVCLAAYLGRPYWTIALFDFRILRSCTKNEPLSESFKRSLALLFFVLTFDRSGSDSLWARNMACMLTAASMFCAMMINYARELAGSKKKLDLETETFLSHAIKQKVCV
jgi:hypothetical protein